MTLVNDKADPITPTIDHHVDEILDTRGRREQIYNYIDYHFEDASGYVRARTYLDKPSVVDLYGPFRSRDSTEPTQAPDLLTAAAAYLGRRFKRVRTGVRP